MNEYKVQQSPNKSLLLMIFGTEGLMKPAPNNMFQPNEVNSECFPFLLRP